MTQHEKHKNQENIDTAAEKEVNDSPNLNNVEELERLKQENIEIKDKLLRTLADNENYKKRTEKQIEENAKYSVSSIAKDMLLVLDNIDRSINAIKSDESEENPLIGNIKTGMEMTKKEFLNIFQKHGIIEISPKSNDDFDHNFHQAVVHIASDKVTSGKIIEVMQSGYKIFDRLLRPAMVSVAK